jgi:hypothetical protein
MNFSFNHVCQMELKPNSVKCFKSDASPKSYVCAPEPNEFYKFYLQGFIY